MTPPLANRFLTQDRYPFGRQHVDGGDPSTFGRQHDRLTLLLLAVFLPPAGALVWLGLSLLAQDRDLLRQREADRREAAAETVARGLVQTLSDVERALLAAIARGNATVRITFHRGRISVEPTGDSLGYQPPPHCASTKAQPFQEAERDEFANRADRGRVVYERLSVSRDPFVRAGALVRSARLARRQGRSDDALAAYRELAKVTGVAVNGMPADLVARRIICDVLRSAGRPDVLTREAAALRVDFSRARWPLDRTSWEVAAADIEKLTGAPAASPEQRALSAAVEIFQSAPRLESRRAAASLMLVTSLFARCSRHREPAGTGLLVVPPHPSANGSSSCAGASRWSPSVWLSSPIAASTSPALPPDPTKSSVHR